MFMKKSLFVLNVEGTPNVMLWAFLFCFVSLYSMIISLSILICEPYLTNYITYHQLSIFRQLSNSDNILGGVSFAY